MKIFSKTIILCLFFACACLQVAFADTLPEELVGAQPLDCAWELCMTPGSGEAPSPVYAAFGDKLYYENGSLPPGTSPDEESNFLGIKYGNNFYASLSYRHTYNISHSWSVTICTLDGKGCKLEVKGIYGTLSAQEHLWLYAEDATTLIQELPVATVGKSVSITVAPGRYVIKYTAEKNFTLTVDGQAETVKYGETVSKKAAAPAKGYEFTHWAISGLSYEESTDNPIAFTMPANDVTLIAQYAAILHTVSETFTLQKGWNLIALPFTELTPPVSGEKDVRETEVYLAQDGKFTKATLKELVGGKAGWIYCENNTELALTGKCPEGDASDFPEYTSGQWNFLGVVGKCNAQGQLIVPVKALPDGAMRWDETKKTFRNASETPVWCMGYLIK